MLALKHSNEKSGDSPLKQRILYIDPVGEGVVEEGHQFLSTHKREDTELKMTILPRVPSIWNTDTMRPWSSSIFCTRSRRRREKGSARSSSAASTTWGCRRHESCPRACLSWLHVKLRSTWRPRSVISSPSSWAAGNVYVAEAKRQLFGVVGIDLLAGPTEILVLVDDTADPSIVAADILGQAEHDPNSRQALVSLSGKIAKQTMAEIRTQLAHLPTREVAEVSWRRNGEVIVVDSPEEAVEVCDTWAHEHLEVQTGDWQYYLENLHNYGSLFLGEETTVAYGDKSIGTNHVLPTMRAARYTGGLYVGKLLKVVTYQYATREASAGLAAVCERACNYENMLAHGISCKVRAEKYSSQS